MSRHRKIEEDSWDEEEEQAATDHVVERFLAQQERGEHGLPRKPRPGQRQSPSRGGPGGDDPLR